jgi:hypothetical protein
VTGLEEALTFPPGGVRHPGRHEVLEAELVRGDERIPVVVKKVLVRGGRDRAERSWQVAHELRARGIDTPEPLAAGRVGAEGWFVARRLQGAEQIRRWFLRREDPAQPRPALAYEFSDVVVALGRLARRLHDSGVFFRDFTDGNVLVTAGDGGPRLWLVDLDRARVSRSPVGAFRRLRDLARPGLNRAEDVNLLLSSYFGAAPAPWPALLGVRLLRARIVLWDALKARARPWRK